MEVFKSFLLIVLIIGVIGGVIYLGYRIMTSPPSEVQNQVPEEHVVKENKVKEPVVSPNTAVEIIERDNDSSNSNGDISETLTKDMEKLYGTGLNINNENPTDPGSAYSYVGFKVAINSKATYYVPKEWKRNGNKMIDPISGANVTCSYRKTKDLLEEEYNVTTYEELLDAFMEAEKAESSDPDSVTFETRKITNSSGEYTVIVKRDGIAVVSYLVYVKDVYEFHLIFSTSEEDYNDLTIDIINNIFSSFKIY